MLSRGVLHVQGLSSLKVVPDPTGKPKVDTETSIETDLYVMSRSTNPARQDKNA
jgi:hypothetical protein